MRRTLLLTLMLPAVLIVTALSSGTDEAARPTVEERPQPTTTTTTTTPGASLPAAPPPAVLGDTSDGADPAEGPDRSESDRESLPEEAREPGLVSDEGFLVAPGGDVTGTGPRWRYTVEVEPATGLDLDAVALDVARSLRDARSWAATRTLEQVDDPAKARIRLVVATPDTVDRLCAQVGLRTVGIYSCWNGRFAALNAWRWDVGAEGFEDILTYRRYLVNHEFGHGLGYGHVGCPSPGAPAPVMMQQSKGLAGCTPNGWPYP